MNVVQRSATVSPGTAQRQRGMSTLSLLVVVALVGLGVTCGLKMVPAYIDYWVLKGIFETVEADPKIKQASPKDVGNMLQKMLDINSIRGFSQKDAVTISRDEGKLFIEFYYEVREELFANVDVVMKFEHHFETDSG